MVDQHVGRALWLDDRRKGIGGTDAAAILGLSRYSSPFQVWLTKKNLDAPRVETEPMWWGTAVEPLIAARFASRTGLEVWKPTHDDGRPRLLAHPEHPCLLASPDYLVRGRPEGLECKTSRQDAEWGEPGTDEVPPGYIIQCQHYMSITGYRRWYLAALIGGNDLRTYVIEADDELAATMTERLVDWWARYIEGGERPPIDGTDETRDWLQQRYPLNRRPLAPAPPESLLPAERLHHVRQTLTEAEELRRANENALKELIGDADGIEAADWRATWKAPKPTRVVNHELVAEHLYQRLQVHEFVESREDLRAAFTEDRPASRRFLFRWKETA